MGIEGRELVDELWVDLADGIDVEQAWVLKGLEDLTVDVVEICGILLLIVLLGEGHVGVGIVGSRGGDVELSGEKGVVLGSHDVCISVFVITVETRCERWDGREKKRKGIQSLYSFYTYVLPKTGYPAVVLCVDVATPTREGEGEEGGGGGGREGSGGLGVGGSGGQGWVGGEGGPASPRESGIGYWLEGGGVYDGVDLATLGAGRLDVVVIVGDEEGRGGVGDGEDGGIGGDGVGGCGRRRPRSLSFRLETGRSPKTRMHLTEGRQRIQEMFKW